jgi:prepilin signal peptidase PulO-like enzyme (type II secretory pathway)
VNAGSVRCPSCRAPVPAEVFGSGDFYSCAQCLTQLQVQTFPALLHAPGAVAAAPVLEAGEATCFYHAQKKAVVACENCGRFLCPLCDVELSGTHLCPACLARGRRNKRARVLETRVIRYDRIALALTTVTVFVWPLMIIAAPAALFIVIKFWNRRSPVLPASRATAIVAAILALAEIAGFIAIALAIFSHRPHA